MNLLEALLVIGGLICQVIGVLLMANGYTAVGEVGDPSERRAQTGSGVPSLLASALVRGKLAKGTAAISHLTPENRLVSLQGLALIGLGFGLQLAASIVELVWTIFSTGAD